LRPYCKTTQSFSRYPLVATIAASLILICPLGFDQSAAAVADPLGKVLIRVRDRVNEEQLAQVQVQLIRFPDGVVGEQFTGSDGSVEFSGLSVGTFTVRASCQGYEPAEAQIDLRNSDRTHQSVDIALMPRRHDEGGPPNGIVAAEVLKIPGNARKEFERGSRLLNEKKDLSRSIAAFQRAIALYPSYADAYFLMGTAQVQARASSAAEASLRKAIALNAHMAAPYYPLAVLLFGERRYAEEAKLLLEAQKLDPADWRFPFELARCRAQQGQWDSALRYGIEASGSDSVPPKVHLLLADIYANSNRPREAVAELELFAKLDPSSSYMGRVREVLTILGARSPAPTSSPSEPR
jgi:tetratricopeptide (TPR) repeat protein